MSSSGIPNSCWEHSQFFDRLVNLVPARFYHNDEAPLPNLKYMKKDARESEKAKRKLHSKVAKRAKLDPDTAQTALDVQHNGVLRVGEAEAEAGEQGEEMIADSAATAKTGQSITEAPQQQRKALLLNGSGSTASMDDLKARLQDRLQMLREKRKAEERRKHAREASKWREKSLKANKGDSRQSTGKRKGNGGSDKPASNPQAEVTEPAANLTFGQLTFGGEGDERAKKRQKKATKAELLQEAEKKAAERQQLAGSAEGQAQLGKSAWSSAVSRAKGEKILDDPKLLRRSLKKEQKEKDKKSAAWKERQQRQKKEGRERQNKRKENLQSRVTAKQQRKKAAREKKLSRPGFEGRRETFINGTE